MRYLPLAVQSLLACSILAGAELAPVGSVGVSVERSAYAAGETAWLRIATTKGAPIDIHLVINTPEGQALFADSTLHFGLGRAVAARNIQTLDEAVEVPVSLANRSLSQPGEYLVQAFVSPVGGAPETWVLSGEARFLVSLPGLNFKAIHDPGSPQFDYECGSCHVDKTRDTFLAPGIPSFHTLKFRLFNGAQWSGSCNWCHEGADLTGGSQAAARKQVAPEKCNLCHSAFGPGSKLFAKP